MPRSLHIDVDRRSRNCRIKGVVMHRRWFLKDQHQGSSDHVQFCLESMRYCPLNFLSATAYKTMACVYAHRVSAPDQAVNKVRSLKSKGSSARSSV